MNYRNRVALNTLIAAAFLIAANALAQQDRLHQAPALFDDYTARVVVYVLICAFLVAVLLIGGILVVNLGMMSKRAEDRTGRRTPSEVGILKGTLWPAEPEERNILPAEEDEEDLRREMERRRRWAERRQRLLSRRKLRA